MKNQNKIFSRTQYCIDAAKNVSPDCIKDLHEFHHEVIEWQNKASKKTHYEDLNIWSDDVYGFIHRMLEKYGFVNGNPEANAKNPEANFWWMVYGLMSSIIYSPYLKSEVAYHHSSAFERNRALLGELNDLLDNLK